MDKIELRKELLEGMCDSAKKISIYCASGIKLTNMRFDNFESPEAFKPGVADKFMFNQIINSVVDNIESELKKRDITNSKMIGTEIMSIYYYPYYSNWIKIDKENIKKFWGLS